MKNEKGVTLVELLAAVVIAGIVIVPLLTIMTGTFSRTISQEKETGAAYVAQEVMEKVRENRTPALQKDGYSCWTNISTKSGCKVLSDIGIDHTTGEFIVESNVKEYTPNLLFNEVKITVTTPVKDINGPSGGIKNRDSKIELTTVVKKP